LAQECCAPMALSPKRALPTDGLEAERCPLSPKRAGDVSPTPSPASTEEKPARWLPDGTGLEVLCGTTVALAQVPEAIAFSFVAGVDPYVGLTAAWIMGVLTSLCGGRPAMISGATGAIAAVTGGMVKEYGVEYLLVTVVLMGLIQLALGALRCGALVRLIPHSVMMGFCNGLAIIIGVSQFASFKRADAGRRLGDVFGIFAGGGWIEGDEAACAAVVALVAFGTCLLFPKLTTKVPASLMAIILASVIEHAIARPLGSGSQTVADFASVQGSLPVPIFLAASGYDLPPLNMETLKICFPLALIMALIGLIESLMTLNLVDELTQSKGDGNRECLGQGFANVVCGLLGGMGGCAMIGQSMINVKSGGRTRLSGVCAGVFLLLILLCMYPLINLIPVAALAGVMFNVVYHTFEWQSLHILSVSAMPARMRSRLPKADCKIRRADGACIVLVTCVTLTHDLAVAVFVGVFFSALMFAWDQSTLVFATRSDWGNDGKAYDIEGTLFFASIKRFLELFDTASDPEKVLVRLHKARIVDYSGVEALNTLSDRYERLGKKLLIEGIREETGGKMLRKASRLVSFESIEALPAPEAPVEASPFCRV